MLTCAGSLCPDTADEAKTLIPSLATKFEDETLQPILDELQKLRMLSYDELSGMTIPDTSNRGSIRVDGYYLSVEGAQKNAELHAWLRSEKVKDVETANDRCDSAEPMGADADMEDAEGSDEQPGTDEE